MSDIWSFLYNPSAASTQNGTGATSTTAMPDWYTDYTRNLLAGAEAATSEPYQPYDQQRLAGLTPDQLSSIDTVRGGVGAWQPTLDAAGNLVQQGANSSSVEALGPLNSMAASAVQPSLTANTASAAQPYLDQAGQALNGTAMQGATGTLGTLANQTLPGNIASYMSPYTDSVVSRIGELGTRNLTENMLPAVNSTFTGAGQFGSTRNADFTNRALRDTNDSVLGAQAQALESGYQNAGQNYLADNSLRTTAANDAGSLLGSNASKLATIGDTASTVGARDYATQQQGAGVLGQLGTQLATAQNQDATRAIQGGQQLGALGQMGQSLNNVDAGALAGAGAMQQTQDQSSLDLAYQDYLSQLNNPKTNLQYLSSIVQGLPVSTSTLYNQNSSTVNNAASALSPLGQFLQTLGSSGSAGKALGV